MLAGPVAWYVLWQVFKLPLTFAASTSLLTLALVIIVYPLLEEIVFRGALQGWLRRFYWMRSGFAGITTANFITSVVFTAFHLLSQSPGWALAVFIPSLVFGWARDRYGHLTASMLLHSFYNAGFIILFR